MRILTFQSGLHDASAAAFDDYEVVAAVQEERLRRQKRFYLLQQATNVSFSSDANGFPVLSRPYFNVTTGQEDREAIAFPGQFRGGVNVSYSTLLGSGEGNFVWNPFKSTGNYPELLLGGRYIDLEDHLSINESITVLPWATLEDV